LERTNKADKATLTTTNCFWGGHHGYPKLKTISVGSIKKKTFFVPETWAFYLTQENPAPVDDFHVKLWLKWGRPATRDGKALGFSLHTMIHGMFLTIKFGMSKKTSKNDIYNLKETAKNNLISISRVLLFSFP
jgi:hypothetical protein